MSCHTTCDPHGMTGVGPVARLPDTGIRRGERAWIEARLQQETRREMKEGACFVLLIGRNTRRALHALRRRVNCGELAQARIFLGAQANFL